MVEIYVRQNNVDQALPAARLKIKKAASLGGFFVAG